MADEVDPRFLLANERTFLAWNRTGLALVGGGLAAGQLLDFGSLAAELVVSLPPIVLGAWLAVSSYRRWRRNDDALRRGVPLPAANASRVLPAGIALMAVIIAIVVILDAAYMGSPAGRTRLAWERTGLSLAANAVLLSTAALHRAAGLLVLPLVFALLTAAARVGRHRAGAADAATLHRLAVLTVIAAVVAAIVVVLPLDG